ncbi:MAG: recombinase family protein [Cellulomonas sp.]|nr:recombinase family protein [Cellulomonas sp.]
MSVENNAAVVGPARSIEALLYGRASKDRHKLMRSIGDQIEECRSWCVPLSWRVAKVVTDADRSASQWRRKEREGFEEAIELIKSGRYGGFVTWEPSRAGRDMAIYVQLRAACQQAGVLYLTHGRVYDFSRSDDAFMLGFEFLRAEADANTMHERQLRTARLNAEKGRPHGRLPYGYRRIYDEHTGALIRQEPDPHTGELVRWMVREVLAGVPVLTVANTLQDQGEPTPQGPRKDSVPRGWLTMTVKQVLRNPTIAGQRVYRGQVVGEAAWEPLISIEDFTRLQRILFDPSRRVHVSDGVTPKGLLSHIARCHYCGRPLTRTTFKARGRAPVQPRIPKYHCRFRGCYKVVIAAGWVDQLVSETAVAWFSRQENIAMLTAEGEDWAARSTQAELRVVELQTRLDEATDQYAAGAVTLATLSRVEATLRPQIEQAQRAAVPPVGDDGIRALVTADDIRAAWEATDLREKRRILKAVFEIRITKAPRLGSRTMQPERVLITPRVQHATRPTSEAPLGTQ